jgi:hypothetical protein
VMVSTAVLVSSLATSPYSGYFQITSPRALFTGEGEATTSAPRFRGCSAPGGEASCPSPRESPRASPAAAKRHSNGIGCNIEAKSGSRSAKAYRRAVSLGVIGGLSARNAMKIRVID